MDDLYGLSKPTCFVDYNGLKIPYTYEMHTIVAGTPPDQPDYRVYVTDNKYHIRVNGATLSSPSAAKRSAGEVLVNELIRQKILSPRQLRSQFESVAKVW